MDFYRDRTIPPTTLPDYMTFALNSYQSNRPGMSIVAKSVVIPALIAAFAATANPEFCPGMRISGNTGNGTQTLFTFSLEKGRIAVLTLRQGERDLVARVAGPQGIQQLFDGFDRREEPILYTAQMKGLHRLEIGPASPSSGSAPYELLFDAVRPPTSDDKARQLAVVTSTRAKNYKTLGEGVEDARSAVRMWARLENPFAHASTLSRLGELLFEQGDWATARTRFEEALTVSNSLGDLILTASCHNDIGVCSRRIGDLDAAGKALDTALALNSKANYPPGIASTRTNRATLFSQVGDFEKAIVEYRTALNLLGNDPATAGERAITLSDLSLALGAIGDYREAKTSLDEAYSLVGSEDHTDAAKILINTGYVLRSGRWVAESEAALRKAVDRAKLSKQKDVLADALVQLGATLSEEGRSQESLDCWQQALRLFPATDRAGRAYTLYQMGGADAASNPVRALLYLSESLRIRQELAMPDAVALTHWRIARALESLHREDAARQHLSVAADIAESLRVKMAGDPFRASYFATKVGIFEDLIRLTMRKGNQREAFETAERSLARSLLDLMAESKEQISRGFDLALLEEANRRQRDLNYWAERAGRVLNGRPTLDEAASVRKALANAVSAVQETDVRLRRASPRFAAFTRPQPATLPDIQRLLDPQTVLVEYWIGQAQSFAWLVSDRSIRGCVLPPRSKIDPLVALTIRQIEGRESTFSRTASRLSEMLLRPFARQLRGKRLAIVGTGSLNFLPFAALPDPDSAPTEDVPLGVVHELTHLPSASILASLRHARSVAKTPRRSPILAFVDPVYDLQDARLQVPPKGSPQGAFEPPSRLIKTRQLANELLTIQPTATVYRDFDATKQLFLSPETSDFPVVELATHVRVRPDQPELTEILFSQVEKQGRPIDGTLRQHEIYNHVQLRADLLVLNACSTAVGQDLRGEGLNGLVRAFLYAGADRVLASRWDTDQTAAYEFMRVFHRQLFDSAFRPTAALREAEIAMSRHADPRWRAPLFSAAFVHYGDWQ